ncbi:hypothetical protein L7F22_017061 [Adiantum nelumboides]|nr:hypothetical protein [Adiantum nelumboides]
MTPSAISASSVQADRPLTAPPKSVPLTAPLSNAAEVLSVVRCLAADLVQQFNGGHPGTAMGAAAIGLALWGGEGTMRFDPDDAAWIDRDRFVLSAGHACLLQYIYLHLAGYKSWTLDMLKRYHSPDFVHSQAAGHPEIEFEGIEVTTGPLGQGIANAVGLAMASKHFAAHFNRPGGHDIVGAKVWCMTGDGCLQEGVGQEAVSLAGHLRLDNLILVYDDNGVTVDGNIDTCFTDDTSAKLASCGWHVIDVEGDATNDVEAILKALQSARNNTSGKPVFVHIRTTIGFGSHNQGLAPTHGAALGDVDVAAVKQLHRQDSGVHFHVPERVYHAFDEIRARGAREHQQWRLRFEAYQRAHPDLAREFQARFSGRLDGGVDTAALLPRREALPTAATPTRKASGLAVAALGPAVPQLMSGSADLMDSTFVTWTKDLFFGSPDAGEEKQSYSGRQVRYGIREHAMAAIANGLAAYAPDAIVPVISTFFMFFLYAAPAVRMAALQRLRIIGIATHDSIGIGEDGPTHQPIALASLFRAMPNLRFIRPADAEEVMGAWKLALQEGDGGGSMPTILSLSRQGVPLLAGSDREAVAKGAYTVVESASSSSSLSSSPQLVLIATGSEVQLAVRVAERLGQTMPTRVVSMPCQALFDAQPASYRRAVLPATSLVVAIEAWSSYGWARYAHASVSMHTFGLSGPQAGLYDYFGFSEDNVAKQVDAFVRKHATGPDGAVRVPAVGDFEELLLGHVS